MQNDLRKMAERADDRGRAWVAWMIGCSLASMVIAAAPACAQAAQNGPTSSGAAGSGITPEKTQDIIVTAQFRNQRLQDTPIAITAVNSALLEARDQRSVVDVGTYSPNVNLSQSSSLNANSVTAFIRGIGQSDSSFALEPGVGIYVDDVYYGTTYGANLDLTDLDRVEVLRGPQGTLSGKNSIGGAVKMFSKKPDGEGGGYAEATYGRFNRLDLRASIDLKLTDDIFVRVSGVSKSSDGYFKELDYGCANPGGGIAASPDAPASCKIGTEGGVNVKSGRLALRYAPAGSPLEINLIGDVTVDKSEVVPEKLIYASNPFVRSYDANVAGGVPYDSRFITCAHCYTSYASFSSGGNYTTVYGTPYQTLPGRFTPPNTSTAKGYGVSGTIDYKLGDSLALKSITAYRSAHGESGIDLDGSPLDVVLEDSKPSHKQFSQELRLTGNIGTLADFTVGGFYYVAHDRLRSRIEIPEVLFDFLGNDPVVNRSKSAFAHLEVHPFENFDLIGGIRYTQDYKKYTFSRTNADGSAISGIPLTDNFTAYGLDGQSGTFKGHRVDFRLGADYRWSPSLMTYAQISTGYKGGGVNPRPYTPDQILPFGPEKLTTYEVGAKADLFGRMLRLNGALFYNDYKDMQLLLSYCAFSVSTACFLPANAGSAHVKGAELEATLRPMAHLTIDGSVGYLDFKYTSVDASTGISKDMIAPFNNKWQASGGIEYAAPLSHGATLTPRLDVAYQSSFYFAAVNNAYNKVDGRALLNARLTFDSADRLWSLSAAVTNLTNKFYYTGKSENIAAYGVALGSPGRPREWSVTLRRHF